MSSIYTTQRQEHLNVGFPLGICPMRSEALRGCDGHGSPAWRLHGDMVAGLPLSIMQQSLVVLRSLFWGDVNANIAGVQLSGQAHIDSTTLEPFDPR